MSMADEQYDAGPPGPPHLLMLAVVVGLLVAWPLFLGGSREAVIDVIANAIAELLGPVGLLLLPVGLLLLIHLLSSHGGTPDAVYHVGGSPIGVALMLVLILALLYYRSWSALFGSGGDDDK